MVGVVFPVLASSSQGFLKMGILVLRVAHRAPQPTSEKLALTGRGQVTGHLFTLGPFHTQATLVPFPELGWSILVLICQVALVTWTFSWSCLLAHGAGQFPLPNQK